MKCSQAITIATLASAAAVSAAPRRKSTGIRRLASSLKRGGRSAFRGTGGVTGAAEHAASIYGFWKQRKAQKAEAVGEGPVARDIAEPAGKLPQSTVPTAKITRPAATTRQRTHRKNGLKMHQLHHLRGSDGRVYHPRKATAWIGGSPIPAAQNQQRDLAEFDGLEMRDFDWELNELD